ncbi:hypothetical protein [Amycolatopsis granulosa]|uniref:hypothetical protein n=1 Tax=Amycolatopsis granulosa TaxID=185684 RepID=UPI00142032FB|nr:hypothetical protein [Amycolatopsis granulosa]NIH84892.1 hypothetical protein [Amycolatopsis granulosa]
MLPPSLDEAGGALLDGVSLGLLLVDDDGGAELLLLLGVDDGGVLALDGGLLGLVEDDPPGSSLRGGGGVPGGRVVPGGMTVPGGSGVPGGNTIGASSDPAGGSNVTTWVPSGLVLTTAVRLPAGSATPSTVTGVWPGAATPGTSCAPELELTPPGPASFGAVSGAMIVASPPNAVASTTPLTASSTYPLRWLRAAESRGGETCEISVRRPDRDPTWAIVAP